MTTDKAMVTDAKSLIDKFEKAFLDRMLIETRVRKEAYDNARAALEASLTLERGEAEPVAVVGIKTMKLSDGRTDYFVAIRCCDREVTPHVFREQYKAAYHVALYHWLLNGGSEPDLMAFSDNDFPAQYCFTSSTLSKRGEAEETPAPVQHVAGPDKATVARHMKDFEEFVAKTAPKLHWTVHQDGSADPSRHNGYYDGWQHGFGEALFGPLPLDRLMAEMKTSVIAKVRARTATTEGRL